MDDRRTHPAGRLLELTAIAILVLGAGTALSRVFRFEAATRDILLVAIVALAASATTTRVRAIVAVPIATLATIWVVAWRVVPAALEGPWPTRIAVDRLVAALLAAPTDARIAIAPVDPTRPFLAAALCGIGATTILAHLLLVRARRPLLAILPPLVVAAVADLSLGWDAPPGSTIALTFAAIAVVLADGVGRILDHGRVEPPLGLGGAVLAAVRGARLPIAVATVVAIAAPGIVPGGGTTPLLDLAGPIPGVTRLQPFVSIRAELERDERRVLFRVRTDGGEAAYWRLFALDRFDGAGWTASPPRLSEPLAGPATLPFAAIVPGRTLLGQDVELVADGIGDGWIPLAYPAARVDAQGTIRFDPDAATVRIDPELGPGDRYTAVSTPLAPDPEALDRVKYLEPSVYGRYTEIPDGSGRALARIATAWTAAEETPYRKILALQSRFLDGSFRYSLDVPESPVDGAIGDPILRFLRQTRVGFCQQFATAMAALVRSLGYPARVAVGFRQGERRGTTYTVTNLDAHAWVEVFFPGIGWLAFEPTPGRPNPAATPGSYLRPQDGDAGAASDGSTTDSTASGADGGPTRDAACTLPDGSVLPARLCRDGAEAAPVPPTPVRGGTTDRRVPIVALILALVLLAGALLPSLRDAARRRRAARAGEPRARTLAAYAIVAGTAADLGLGRWDAETLPEYLARIERHASGIGTHLRDLVDLTVVAAYGRSAPGEAEASRAVAIARRGAARLRRDAGWRRRILGAYGVAWEDDAAPSRGSARRSGS